MADDALVAARRALVRRLSELGYYRYATPRNRFMLKRQQEARGLFLWRMKLQRDHPADSESLAECGVKLFLLRIAPFLKSQGVEFSDIQEEYSDDGYQISIDRSTYEIFSGAELAADEAASRKYREAYTRIKSELDEACEKGQVFPDEPHILGHWRAWKEMQDYEHSVGKEDNIWLLSERRTCALINKLLIEAGSEERAFSYPGGHDHMIYFLTEAQYNLLKESGLDEAADELILYGPEEFIARSE